MDHTYFATRDEAAQYLSSLGYVCEADGLWPWQFGLREARIGRNSKGFYVEERA